MDLPSIVIGIAALLFGVYTIYVRQTNPEKFGKLHAMKQNYGEKKGTVIHFVFYSLLPIVFGVVMVYSGYRGVSFF